MNFETLFNHLEKETENNKNYYKEIHSILYFNNEDFLENPDFLNEDNEKKELYDIKLEKLSEEKNEEKNEIDNFQKFSDEISSLFHIKNMNISSEYKSIVDCILKIINYKNIDGKRDLFEKMIRDFDALKLYKRFNFKKRKICKKNEIRELLLSHNDNNEIILHFLVHYISINMIIIENDKYSLYSENDIFEPFKTTVLIYKYNKNYYFLSTKIDNKNFFTSDDDFVMKIYNLQEEDNKNDIDDLENIMSNLDINTKKELVIEDVIDINLKSEKKIEQKTETIEIEQPEQVEIEQPEKLETEKPEQVEPEQPEQVEPEQVNYKKMKVGDLKKLCKEKGIKGYSKLKKNEVIELLLKNIQ